MGDYNVFGRTLNLSQLYFVFHMHIFFCLFLVVSTGSIDCVQTHCQNDLSCVEWDVKPS